MIHVSVTRDRQGVVSALKVSNHGEPIVCAAVSALVLNAVNSIHAFTDEEFICQYNEDKGGFLEITFTNTDTVGLGHDALLLISSLMLGLSAVYAEYPNNITIDDQEAAS